jgi:restriction system protein
MEGMVTVPDYQSLMAPRLHVLAGGEPLRARAAGRVAQSLSLKPEDREQRIPSGSFVFDSRVHWAITYMAQAGFVRRPRRAFVPITDR